MLKKSALVAAVFAIAVSVSACDSGNGSTATSTLGMEPQISATENVAPKETKNTEQYGMLNKSQKDTVFRNALKDNNMNPVIGTTWDDYIGLADSMCQALDTGASLKDVVDIMSDGGIFTDEQVGYFIGASIAVYCPQHEDLIG